MDIVWWSNNMWDNILSYVFAPLLVLSAIFALLGWVNIAKEFVTKCRKDKVK